MDAAPARSMLRSGFRDARLLPRAEIGPASTAPDSTDGGEHLQARMNARILAHLDSADSAAVGAAAAQALVTRDRAGRAWGLTPGKLHLGPLTVPFPYGGKVRPDPVWEAIRGQEEQAERARVAAERARATRERLGGGGPP